MKNKTFFKIPIKWTYKYFGNIGEQLVEKLNLDRKIKYAAINISPQGYGAILSFYILISLLLEISTAIISLIVVKNILPLLILTPIILSIPIILTIYPQIKANIRKKHLSIEFPFITIYIGLMSLVGISPYKSFERLANQEILKAAKEEAKLIIKEKTFFTKEPTLALESIAKNHPLKEFQKYILNYISISKTGGNAVKYLIEYGSKVTELMRNTIKKYAEDAKLYGDLMITLFVFAPLGIFSIMSILAVNQGIIFMKIYSYLLSPIIALALILAINSDQPKFQQETINYLKLPIKILSISIPIVIALKFIKIPFPIQLNSYELISIVILSSLIPSAIAYEEYVRECSKIEEYLPNFLRDIAEARRIGLSIEKILHEISNKNYGKLTKIIRQIEKLTKYTLTPIDKAIEQTIKQLKSWISKVILWLFKEAIIAGGGNPETFELLAKFTEDYLEVKRKISRELKSYYIIGYIASIMLLIIMLQIINFGLLTQTQIAENTPSNINLNIKLPSKEELNELMNTCFNSIIIISSLIGLIMGKISSGNIAGGFKHSIICTLISLVGIKGVKILW